MNVGRALLVLVVLLGAARAGDDQLIRLGEKHTCIRQVISVFVATKNCDLLDDAAKSNLALKMTECLLQQMGKGLPAGCGAVGRECRLEGDSWSTFSTFFAHIDNLCHFYWEMLHHERAEALIGQLSESSHNAELLLRQNARETEKILEIQQTMHVSMEESLTNQRQMTALINSSARQISNLTVEMESFVKRIHNDINENYGSVRNVLTAMNEALTQALSIQTYMSAELSSIRGTLYFLSHFLLILFLTTFRRYVPARMGCLVLLGVNLLSEVSFGGIIENLVGTHRFRYFFILIELAFIYHSDSKENQFERAASLYLNTPRLKSVFRRAIAENEAFLYHGCRLSSHQNQQMRQKAKSLEASGEINSQE